MSLMKIAICWPRAAVLDAVQKAQLTLLLALGSTSHQFSSNSKDVWIRSSLVYMKDVIIQCDVNNLL